MKNRTKSYVAIAALIINFISPLYYYGLDLIPSSDGGNEGILGPEMLIVGGCYQDGVVIGFPVKYKIITSCTCCTEYLLIPFSYMVFVFNVAILSVFFYFMVVLFKKIRRSKK